MLGEWEGDVCKRVSVTVERCMTFENQCLGRTGGMREKSVHTLIYSDTTFYRHG